MSILLLWIGTPDVLSKASRLTLALASLTTASSAAILAASSAAAAASETSSFSAASLVALWDLHSSAKHGVRTAAKSQKNLTLSTAVAAGLEISETELRDCSKEIFPARAWTVEFLEAGLSNTPAADWIPRAGLPVSPRIDSSRTSDTASSIGFQRDQDVPS